MLNPVSVQSVTSPSRPLCKRDPWLAEGRQPSTALQRNMGHVLSCANAGGGMFGKDQVLYLV